MRAAAGQARDGTADAADARKFLAAIWAPINEARHVSPNRKREIMTAPFSLDSKITTRLSPLLAVREDPATTGTKLSEKMGQFMAKRAIDFGRMLRQPRV
jgi:hypothetical protein